MRFPSHECGLYLEHNEHRDIYMKLADYEKEQNGNHDNDYFAWVSEEQRQLALQHDSFWRLQWYPKTPISFCFVSAYDLDVLLRAACEEDEK